ncbi:MAG: glycosyltransferase family 2 protein [Pelagimonas sp.]|jgi:hypothetical protein|nr:glycosyltransferase family 2 protein [Pelagimonas sp.]
MTKWGTVSTIKSPLREILNFAAWHLEQGAHRLYIYLDEDAPQTQTILQAHPKIKAQITDAAYWEKRKGRPEMHQVRQTTNARHANNRRQEVDWLAHIDVDEFLLPARPIAQILSELPETCLCARVRPIEALANPQPQPETYFKAFHLGQTDRQEAAAQCFPTWGQHLSGGFLSHVAGKLFFRAGTKGLQPRIHNVRLKGDSNPGQVHLTEIELAHFHAADWDHFLRAYRFRLERGSYRAELQPQVRSEGAVNLHDLFNMIEAEGGEAALRLMFDEVCTATPDLRARLQTHGLLRSHVLPLDDLREKHFPGVQCG